MGNLIRAEWFKLRWNRSFWLLSGLILLASVLIPTLERSVSFWRELAAQGQVFALAMDFNNRSFIKLAPAVLAGFFISSEYALGTMKNIVASGHSRLRIYMAKLVVFAVGTMLLALMHPIVTTLTVSLLLGDNVFPPLAEAVSGLGFLLLYAAAFAAIVAAFAILFANSGIAVTFLVLFFLANSILANFPVLRELYDYSVFQYVFELGQGRSLSGVEHIRMLLIPVVTIISFGLLGAWLFQRKEIK